MNLNLTLIGQMLTFVLFVWVTMKYVWPPITKAMAERQDNIADGLAAAERGRLELELAQQHSTQLIREAKQEATAIIDQANRTSAQMIEEAKLKAKQEGDRQLQLAKDEIAQEFNQAKLVLSKQVARIAMKGAEKILGREVDEAANSNLINKLIEEI